MTSPARHSMIKITYICSSATGQSLLGEKHSRHVCLMGVQPCRYVKVYCKSHPYTWLDSLMRIQFLVDFPLFFCTHCECGSIDKARRLARSLGGIGKANPCSLRTAGSLILFDYGRHQMNTIPLQIIADVVLENWWRHTLNWLNSIFSLMNAYIYIYSSLLCFSFAQFFTAQFSHVSQIYSQVLNFFFFGNFVLKFYFQNVITCVHGE